MKHTFLIASLLLLGLSACDDKTGDAKPADAKSADAKPADAKPADAKADAGDTKPAADAPDCTKVVEHIASFNEGSGDAEKKLWNKMCDEMTGPQRTCVSKAENMDGMKACMKDKGKQRLN